MNNKNKPSFLPEEGFSPNGSPSSAGHQTRVMPERCKSQFVSINSYSISKEQPSLPLEIEKMLELSDFLDPDEISLLCETQNSDLNEQTANIVDSLQCADNNNAIIANKLEEFAQELKVNGHFLENVPEFTPKYLQIQEIRGLINVSHKLYDTPNSQIYAEIPNMFS